MKGYTVVFWDQLSEAHVEAMLKDLYLAMPAGKAKVREHPMPGWKDTPTGAPPKQWTYTKAHPKTETPNYTPESVVKEWMYEYRFPECYASTLVERLKKYGFEITPIKVSIADIARSRGINPESWGGGGGVKGPAST